MTTLSLIEGLQILSRYYTRQNGHNIGANHDIIYGYATDRPLSATDITRMIELGWIQEECSDENGYFIALNYDPYESWAAYV